jgi:formylglycine-generating enzyme required for sulfatase activity
MPDDMVRIGPGRFRMGSEAFYPEEGPVRSVAVEAFELDRFAVTNADFARFVDETGYLTTAERALDPAEFPGLDDYRPGSLVFVPTPGPVDLSDWRQWWRWVPGATWRQPQGPGSSIEGRDDHPVVQVSFADASAYAEWAGKRLPTEAEWEYAARGGLDGATFAWGEEPNGPEALRANTWQGRFPYRNTGANGWVGTAPVGSFPPNGYGLHEMTGNTWEWTVDPWTDTHAEAGDGCTCGPDRPVGASAAPGETTPRRVLKGGSHLCAPEYCLRYRPAARSPEAEDTSTTHIGFRCAR